jgi:hypothetical protein
MKKLLILNCIQMKLNFSICLFLLIHSFADGQTKDTILIIPGHKLLQSNSLTDYHAKYDFISYKEGVEKIVGGIEDNFKIITNGKEKQGLRICNITFGTNTILDSGLCVLKGLKPIYHRSVQTKKRLNLIFNGESIKGTVTTISETINKIDTINYKASTPLFDSYYEDIIAKTIKLKKGLLFKFPEYIYERGGIVWSDGEVVAKDTSHSKNDDIYHIWKIIFHEKNNEGKVVRTTIYRINEIDRKIITREYQTLGNRVLMKQRQG